MVANGTSAIRLSLPLKETLRAAPPKVTFAMGSPLEGAGFEQGGGEGAIIPVGGLMANAVANALASFGAMPNELPLSPPRVWRLANLS